MRRLLIVIIPLFLVTSSLIYYLIFLDNRSTKSSPISPLQSLVHLPTPTQIPTPTITKTVAVGLVGDLGLGRHITSTARNKKDFSWSFQGIAGWLAENNFTLANLESPIINDCPLGVTGTFTFCGDTRFLPYLKSHNFTFNLNNNHILNYGQDGLSQTTSFLLSGTIPAFYDNFLVQTIDGIKFGFLGFDFITYPKLDHQIILQKIRTVNPQVNHLIVSVHWGNEYLLKPETWRVDLARAMVDAGADIIHGHHPHVWQGMEIYNDKYIFYSFGNFIFDQSWSYDTSHSQIARLTVAKDKIIDSQLFPIEIKSNSQPWLMP